MTTAQRPERSVPKPQFTDAEAGAQEFPDSGASARRYNYYKPAKRKQTHYEDVTVDVQPDRYETFARAAVKGGLQPAPRHVAEPWWSHMRRKGRLLSLVRLAKASATFAGGADYLAWKINRHSNAGLELQPWQRRFPVIAAITLLPRLLKSGAVR